LRAVIFMVLFYFWGRLTRLSLEQLRKLIVFMVWLQVAVALFGIFEWTFLSSDFWSRTVGIGNFMLDVKGLADYWNVEDGLPSNMFRFGWRRLISTYGDPLSMGIATVLPLLVAAGMWIRPRQDTSPVAMRWKISASIMMVALLLTIGRESIAAAIGGILLIAWFRDRLSGLLVPASLCVAILLSSAELLTNLWQTVTFQESSAATHLDFLQANLGLTGELWMGKGLGEAGGWAVSLMGVESQVGESSYFELMAQTGIVSVVLMLGFLIAITMRTFRLAARISEPLMQSFCLALSVSLMVRMVLTLMSPSLFAVVPMASLFFLAGAAFTAIPSPIEVTARRVLVLQQVPASVEAAG
jgi:hypothetical protein